jgi:hypothetical protein
MENLLKHVMKVLMIGLVAFLANLAAPADVGAQCVQCIVVGGCFACGAAAAGGTFCPPPLTCSRCTIADPCTGNKKPKLRIVPLGDDPFTGIGAEYARIGIQTLHLSRLDETPGSGETVWTPVPIASSDLHWWYNPEEPGADPYFAAYEAQAMDLNLNGVSPVKYRWILEQNPASLNEATLTIDVVQGSSVDPSYTKLTLNLVKDTDRWRIVGHRLE